MTKIFSSNGDVESSAILNWRLSHGDSIKSDFTEIADGYFLAAKYASEGSLKEPSHKEYDIVVFPALFCTIQACELYLKAINMTLKSYMSGKDETSEGKRNI